MIGIGWPALNNHENKLEGHAITTPKERLKTWLHILVLTERGERVLLPTFGLPMRWEWRGKYDCSAKLIAGIKEHLPSVINECNLPLNLTIPEQSVHYSIKPPPDLGDFINWKDEFLKFSKERLHAGLIYANAIQRLVPINLQIVDGNNLFCNVYIEVPISRWCEG